MPRISILAAQAVGKIVVKVASQFGTDVGGIFTDLLTFVLVSDWINVQTGSGGY